VSNSMSEMDKVVQSNAANSEETASAAKELSSLGAELEQMVKGLRVLVGNGRAKDKLQIQQASKPEKTKNTPNKTGDRSHYHREQTTEKIKRTKENTAAAEFADDFSGF
ncbi:MAG TPA: hypothetical protein VKM36_07810, partial [Balneolaceae bacterium]|nr:hypothetical protein [Balneolaceae bacterium]